MAGTTNVVEGESTKSLEAPAAWAGLILILLFLPTAVIGMLGHPMAFEELYRPQPFFSFSIHFMIVACFSTQGFLYLLALLSTRSHSADPVRPLTPNL